MNGDGWSQQIRNVESHVAAARRRAGGLGGAAPVFAALGDETRLRIVVRLCRTVRCRSPVSPTARTSRGKAITTRIRARRRPGWCARVRCGVATGSASGRSIRAASPKRAATSERIGAQWDDALLRLRSSSKSSGRRTRRVFDRTSCHAAPTSHAARVSVAVARQQSRAPRERRDLRRMPRQRGRRCRRALRRCESCGRGRHGREEPVGRQREARRCRSRVDLLRLLAARRVEGAQRAVRAGDPQHAARERETFRRLQRRRDRARCRTARAEERDRADVVRHRGVRAVGDVATAAHCRRPAARERRRPSRRARTSLPPAAATSHAPSAVQKGRSSRPARARGRRRSWSTACSRSVRSRPRAPPHRACRSRAPPARRAAARLRGVERRQCQRPGGGMHQRDQGQAALRRYGHRPDGASEGDHAARRAVPSRGRCRRRLVRRSRGGACARWSSFDSGRRIAVFPDPSSRRRSRRERAGRGEGKRAVRSCGPPVGLRSQSSLP